MANSKRQASFLRNNAKFREFSLLPGGSLVFVDVYYSEAIKYHSGNKDGKSEFSFC